MASQELEKHSCGETRAISVKVTPKVLVSTECVCDVSLQLAVDVQVPQCFGGLGGQVVYIDTEGSFLVQRVVDLASAAVRHCALLAEDDEQKTAMATFTVETILSNMFLVRQEAEAKDFISCR